MHDCEGIIKIYSPIENHILLYRTTGDIIEYIDFYSFFNSENSRGWDMMENTTITGQYEVLLPWHVIV